MNLDADLVFREQRVVWKVVEVRFIFSTLQDGAKHASSSASSQVDVD